MRNLFTFLFLAAAAAASAQDLQTTTTQNTQDEKKFLVNVSAGPSYRIAKSPPVFSKEQSDYIKDLKSGFSYDVSAYYLLDEHRGIGLKHNSYSSKGSLANQQLSDPNGDEGIGTASDDITITFIGVAAIYEGKGFADNHIASFEAALGYMGYVNNATILEDYKLTGGTLGMAITAGYQFIITEEFSVGPTVGFTGGALKSYILEGDNMRQKVQLGDDTVESLYRIDLSVTARVRF